MTFIAADLAARIRLEGKEAFDAALRSSGREFTALERIAKTSGDALMGTLKGAGVALNTTVAAAGALTIGVFKTGAAYNNLQQTSRAALTTLLGSAEKVNEQMTALDTFARTSPFSKQVFIQAQQQMIGFGFAAEDVIPTLDAVQNATAGIGGSNQTLSELVFIMSQIKAAGKITGQDLLQFGQRGVNAAELIGKAMGMTGAEIRNAITEGTLDADEALSALTRSMQEKYGGTTAMVKEQFAGAADRVKAATRDIGAALAKPFIDPNGGGMAVTWGNKLADLLRAVEAQTTPFTNWAVQKLNPTFQKFETILTRAKQSVQQWDFSMIDRDLGRLSSYAPGIGLAVGALSALGTNIPILSRLGIAINPVVGGILGLVAASPEMRTAGRELLTALSPLIPVAVDLAGVLARGLNSALPVVADGIELVADVARPLIAVLDAIPAPVLAGAIAFGVLRSNLGNAITPSIVSTFQRLNDEVALHRTLASMAGTEVGTFGAAMSVARGRAVSLGTAIKGAFLSNPVGIALTIISGAIALWATANADAEAKVEEHKQAVADLQATLDKTTGVTTDATRAQLAQNLVSGEYIDKLKKLGIESNTFVDAMLGEERALAAVESRLGRLGDKKIENVLASRGLKDEVDRMGLSYADLQRFVDGDRAALDALGATARENGFTMMDLFAVTNQLGDGFGDTAATAVELADYLEQQRDRLGEAQDEAQAYRMAMNEAAAAMSDAALSNARLNEAVGIARDTSEEATTRIDALKRALDELRGGVQSAEEAQFALAEQSLNLSDILNQTDENGSKLGATLLDASGAINRTTREGISLFGAVNDINDSMLVAVQSAYDLARAEGDDLATAQQKARDAAAPFIESLRQTATDAGLTAEQTQGLIDKYLAVPSTVVTLISDDGTIGTVEQQLLTLADQIARTPDKTITISEPLSPEITRRLERLGIKVNTLPDGTVQVVASGIDDVERKINYVARQRTATVRVGMPGMTAQADGGLWAGPRQAFANGGLTAAAGGLLRREPMIVKGGANILWGEPETGWEAYISGKPGMEARNRAILAIAAQRLGMEVVRGGGSGPAPVASVTSERAGTSLSVTLVNPVSRDPFTDAQEAGELLIAGLDV